MSSSKNETSQLLPFSLGPTQSLLSATEHDVWPASPPLPFLPRTCPANDSLMGKTSAVRKTGDVDSPKALAISRLVRCPWVEKQPE